MLYMNEHDIADAVYRTADLPNARRAAETLERLAQWTNANSDGWAYWPKPCRAARRLQELLQSVDRYAPEDVTAEEVALALRPVKAFLTRQGVDHGAVIGETAR